jgi:hypothetical protein
MSIESIDRLVRGFESGTLPRAEWTHAAHLTTALFYVRAYGQDEAARRLQTGIRRYNAAVGGDPSAYHDTITLAWVAVVARFLEDDDRGQPLTVLADRLVAQCGEKDYLLRFYSRERLFSPEARAGWLPPDRAPIERAGAA